MFAALAENGRQFVSEIHLTYAKKRAVKMAVKTAPVSMYTHSGKGPAGLLDSGNLPVFPEVEVSLE